MAKAVASPRVWASRESRSLLATNRVASTRPRSEQDAGRDSVGKSEAREDSDRGGGFTGDQVNEGTFGTVPVASSLSHTAFVDGATRLVRTRQGNALGQPDVGG